MKRWLIALACALLTMNGAVAPDNGITMLQQELAKLTSRGMTYRILDNNMLEIADPMTGVKQVKSLSEPNETAIRSWAASRQIPILEIDPNTIDTSRYAGWYKYWTTIPLGNSFGNPLVIGDANHNGQADVYGAYLDTLSWDDYQARLYEVDTLGRVFLRHKFVPRPGISNQFADVDKDSLVELVWSYGGIVSGYEQNAEDSLPIHRIYEHERYYHNTSSGYTAPYLGNLDGDGLTDLLYLGSGPDPNDTNIAIAKTYVAEHDPSRQSFVRVWSTQFPPGSGAYGYSVGDFDDDAKMEFVATRPTGNVYIVENSGDNQYITTWRDSLPFVNLYYQGSGDIDDDGKLEFFAGATMSNGAWVMMYEADSNNAYSAKFLFHLLSGGLLVSPIFEAVDLDGDRKPELAMAVGSDLYVFKSDTDNSYYLSFFRREVRMEATTFHDLNYDGRMDLVASKFGVNSGGRGWFYADVYLASPLVGVKEQTQFTFMIQLLPNYPNPFNPSTNIKYDLPEALHVTLAVYDVLGRKVVELVNGRVAEGYHAVTWNAADQASGVYFARFTATATNGNVKFARISKLVLTK